MKKQAVSTLFFTNDLFLQKSISVFLNIRIENSFVLKTIISYLFKIFASAYIVYYLIYKVNWLQLPAIVKQIEWKFFVFAVLIYLAKYFFDALRWHLVNKLYNVNIDIVQLFKYKIIGPAFDFVTPLPQGDDIYKFMVLRAVSESVVNAISIPVLIRATGLLSIVIFVPFSLWHYKQFFHLQFNYSLFIFALFVPVLLFTFYHFKIFPLVNKYVNKGFEHLKILLNTFKTRRRLTAMMLMTSMLSHLSYITFIWMLINSMSINFSFTTILLSLPLIYVAAIFPSVAGGIGIKEGVILWLLTFHGVDVLQAQAVALCHLFIILFFVITGFFCLLTEKQNLV